MCPLNEKFPIGSIGSLSAFGSVARLIVADFLAYCVEENAEKPLELVPKSHKYRAWQAQTAFVPLAEALVFLSNSWAFLDEYARSILSF